VYYPPEDRYYGDCWWLFTGTTDSLSDCGTIAMTGRYDFTEETVLLETNVSRGDEWLTISQTYNYHPREGDTGFEMKRKMFVDSIIPGVSYNRETGKVFYNRFFPKLVNDVPIGTTKSVTWEEAGIDDKIFGKYVSMIKEGKTSPDVFNVHILPVFNLDFGCRPPIYIGYTKYWNTTEQITFEQITFRDGDSGTDDLIIDAIHRTVVFGRYEADMK
jgi:hypothetical protein